MISRLFNPDYKVLKSGKEINRKPLFSPILPKFSNSKSIWNPEVFQQTFNIHHQFGLASDSQSFVLQKQFQVLPKILQQVPNLIKTKKFDSVLKSDLPLLETNHITDHDTLMYLFSVYGAFLNGYVWRDFPQIYSQIPENIAIPLIQVSEKLRTTPLFNYSGLLNSWFRLDKNLEHEVENLRIKATFTDSIDQQIFYTVALKGTFIFADIFTELCHANKNARLHNLDAYNENLEKIGRDFNLLNQQLPIMYRYNSAQFFHETMRIFFGGSTDQTQFPNGWNYKGTEHESAVFSGGSAGQDGSYQIFERGIGINYKDDKDLDNLQRIMRIGMIGSHRDAIEFMGRHSQILQFALHSGNQSTKQAYNHCIQAYINFNRSHNQYLTHYIENQVQKTNPQMVPHLKGTGNAPIVKIRTRHIYLERFLLKN